jgi:uncharacterized protein YdeI (YjbR/CyaY-like superfamily)
VTQSPSRWSACVPWGCALYSLYSPSTTRHTPARTGHDQLGPVPKRGALDAPPAYRPSPKTVAKMEESPHYIEFGDRSQWRAWLEAHHADTDVVWLVHYKKGFQESTLLYEDAVEEALCFGWIDGQLRRLDERRYILRYTPRRRNSVWSISNIRRAERLSRQGRMTLVGLDKIAEAKETGQWQAAIRREQVDIIPPDLEGVLERIEGAVAAYHALPDSRKKQFIYWLQTAKRPATKRRRIAKIVAEVVRESPE